MGRKNGAQVKPQAQRLIRSQLPSNRELNAALTHPRPRAFGIRRRVEPSYEAKILGILTQLQADEDIPEKVELRKSLHVTLLSARAVGRQMMRGLVAGYELGKKGNAVRSIAEDNGYFEQSDVHLAKDPVNVYQGYSLYLAVESDGIAQEVGEIHEVLGAHGVKGFLRDEQKLGLHISLGEAKQSRRLSKTEQRHVRHTIQEQLDAVLQSAEIPLLGWEVYP